MILSSPVSVSASLAGVDTVSLILHHGNYSLLAAMDDQRVPRVDVALLPPALVRIRFACLARGRRGR